MCRPPGSNTNHYPRPVAYATGKNMSPSGLCTAQALPWKAPPWRLRLVLAMQCTVYLSRRVPLKKQLRPDARNRRFDRAEQRFSFVDRFLVLAGWIAIRHQARTRLDVDLAIAHHHGA